MSLIIREAKGGSALFAASFISLALLYPIWNRIGYFDGYWPRAFYAYGYVALVATASHAVSLFPILKISKNWNALRGFIRALIVFLLMAVFALRHGTVLPDTEMEALLFSPFFAEWRFVGFIASYASLVAAISFATEWLMNRDR
ncbi:MAG TPA: hypothetical protein VM009_00590 [Terriglobales bacterium]|nr:hypothetical protein [Terriglobales bacterium]